MVREGDLQAYFDSKVKEKMRKGYKVVDKTKAVKTKLAAELEKLKEENPTSEGTKKRVDFDKCAELVCFCVSRALGHEHKENGYEMFEALFPAQIKVGQDVCYGSIACVSMDEEVARKILAVEEKQIEEVFDNGKFPICLGALCDVSKERDMEYCLIHFKNLKLFLTNCLEHKCGMLFHYW